MLNPGSGDLSELDEFLDNFPAASGDSDGRFRTVDNAGLSQRIENFLRRIGQHYVRVMATQACRIREPGGHVGPGPDQLHGDLLNVELSGHDPIGVEAEGIEDFLDKSVVERECLISVYHRPRAVGHPVALQDCTHCLAGKLTSIALQLLFFGLFVLGHYKRLLPVGDLYEVEV